MLNLFTLIKGRGGVPNTFPARIWTPNLESMFLKWFLLIYLFFVYKWFPLISLKIKVATPHSFSLRWVFIQATAKYHATLTKEIIEFDKLIIERYS